MTSLVIYETVHAIIADEFPADERPAENAFLLEKYASQPEPTAALDEAAECALQIIARVTSRNLYLPPMEAEGAGLEQFIEEFTETLHEEASMVFGGA